MKKIMRLALYTEDFEYAAAFAEALAATQRGFLVNLVTDAKSRDAVDSDVLIMDKTGSGVAGLGCGDSCPENASAEVNSLSDGASNPYINEVSCLSDDTSNPYTEGFHAYLEIIVGRGADSVVVDKYAGCARICAEVKAAYAAVHGLKNFASAAGASGTACLISFIGIEGGAGASSAALGLAGELSAYRGKKVLYLNFEAFESPRLGTGGRMAVRADMSRFLFALLGEERERNFTVDSSRSSAASGAAVSVEPYIARDDYGVMRFPPFAGLNRFRELRGAQLRRFMHDVVDGTGADMVIADWGGGLTDEAVEYIGVSSFVVLVVRHGGAKTHSTEDGSSLLRLADELGVDRSRVVVVSGRSPASGNGEYSDAGGNVGYSDSTVYGSADRRNSGSSTRDAASVANAPANDIAGGADSLAGYVEICEDPYAFDRDGERISISLATSFGTGVKKLADIVLGTGDDLHGNFDDSDILFTDDDAEATI
jgi:cellulose biosynthesis protein BcsQ